MITNESADLLQSEEQRRKKKRQKLRNRATANNMETARPEKKKKPVLLPRIIFGTGSLGNLYAEPPYEDKRAVIEAAVKSAAGTRFNREKKLA